MCGIIGYVGNKNAPDLVYNGLKRLEYRGYDSWGLAFKNGSEINIEKHVGPVTEAQALNVKSNISLGHTRWATHGKVSEINAHPHYSCNKEVVLVHNGIIENYSEIKKFLSERGHKFRTETDTEVIAHLIEEELKSNNNVLEAFSSALKKLKGSYAIVMMVNGDGNLYFARKDSPLVVGISDHGIFLASDPSAFIEETKKVMFLDDGEFGYTNGVVKIFDIETGKEKQKEVKELDWDLEKANKGGYDYYMEKEIFEQSESLINTVSIPKEEIDKVTEMIKNAFGVFFIGSGSSYHAALVGSYVFSKISKFHVNVVDASEFIYYLDFLTPETLVIAISQSGETADVLDAVKKARKKGSKVVAITNVIGSTLARISDFTLHMNAGIEIGVASTKTFTSQLALLYLLAYNLAGRYEEAKENIEKVAKTLDKVLNGGMGNRLDEISEMLKEKEHIFVIGRGISHAVAYEAALKLKEITYIHAEGFSGGFLKHGTIALIEKGTPLIVFAPNDETYDEIISNAEEVKARGGIIIGVSPKDNDVFDYHIKVPDLGDVTAIASIIPIQYLSYKIAVLRGLNPDKPRNLAKSVTVK